MFECSFGSKICHKYVDLGTRASSFYIHTLLLTLLLVAVCVIGILAVTFRTCVLNLCCKKSESEADSTPETSGHRNFAYDDQEGPRTVSQRPFNAMEPTECPPTYEEAIQQELFRFRLPLASVTIQEPIAENQNSSQNQSSSTRSSVPATTSNLQLPSPQTSPSTSQRPHTSRSRTTTTSSNSNYLSTIDEEEDEWPVQVVIDCIGIQTAKLLEKCETTVHLANGNELNTNSKC